MASRPKYKFNMIKTQIDRDQALIPSPGARVGEVATATTFVPTMAAARWESDYQRTLQEYIGAAQVSSTGQTWVVNGSSMGWSSFSGSVSDSSSNRGMMPTHDKMKGKDRPWAAELLPHWERARKLGLTAQKEAIEKMVLRKDIEELTKGAGYPEVTDQDLEAMFEFPRLRRKLRWHNLKQVFKRAWAWVAFEDSSNKIILRLKKDRVEASGVAIPFGAQLRLEEAKEMGLFESFQVVYPNVITEAALAAERARERDPALVGIYQGAMFLICSWDLPQDVKRVEADMEALKALKIEG